jgi:hypothetical protein
VSNYHPVHFYRMLGVYDCPLCGRDVRIDQECDCEPECAGCGATVAEDGVRCTDCQPTTDDQGGDQVDAA